MNIRISFLLGTAQGRPEVGRSLEAVCNPVPLYFTLLRVATTHLFLNLTLLFFFFFNLYLKKNSLDSRGQSFFVDDDTKMPSKYVTLSLVLQRARALNKKLKTLLIFTIFKTCVIGLLLNCINLFY